MTKNEEINGKMRRKKQNKSKIHVHSKIETTENYYITSTIDTLKKVSESFEKEIYLEIIIKNIIDD